jgi:hypothetical protein
MSDTPEWLRRLMERDPRAEDPAPLDDLTKHRMVQSMRESGRKQEAEEQRKLAVLWTRWGLVRHPLHYMRSGLQPP